jgi:hydrogenase nickel incorporation protein HypA/HybF
VQSERVLLSETGGCEHDRLVARGDRGGTRVVAWLRSRKRVHPVHELALMESVVDQITGLIDARVALVRLEIGELAGVDVEALRFCFGVCTQNTPLAGAELDIVRVHGRAHCHSCGAEQPTRSLVAPCTCGSFDRAIVTGTELRLKEVEVL